MPISTAARVGGKQTEGLALYCHIWCPANCPCLAVQSQPCGQLSIGQFPMNSAIASIGRDLNQIGGFKRGRGQFLANDCQPFRYRIAHDAGDTDLVDLAVEIAVSKVDG